jgi:Ca-activated chloride channel family protein
MFRFSPPFGLPLWLFAIVVILLISAAVYLYFRLRKGAGLRFSSTKNVKVVPVSLRQRLSLVPPGIRVLALVFLALAIARPQEGKELVRDTSKGIAIEMVVDRSSSMSVVADFGTQTLSRLDVVKKAFTEFVIGGGSGLKGRPQDLIGMITFAHYPDTVCPLTLSHDALIQFIDSTKNVIPNSPEDGTSIGDGIALAAARLKTAEVSLAGQLKEQASNYIIKSKIMILLTDGEDTGIGKRTPLEAAALAKEWGIKIYTIGLSGKDWYMVVDDILGKRKAPVQSRVDTALLQKIADSTGGMFRIASDIGSLIDIYKEIDALEKSEIESVRFLDYKEFFIPFALIGLALLAIEFALSHTYFRRIP